MIPINATVRWRPDIYKAPPLGKVTARNGRRLEIGGGGWWVSEGLLEVVEMDGTTRDDEIAGLQALVVQQCGLIATMVPAPTPDEVARREDLEAFVDNVRDYLEDLLLVLCGERNPAKTIELRELNALRDFVMEGVQ